MAIKYLDAKRLQGTNAERLALTTTGSSSALFSGSGQYARKTSTTIDVSSGWSMAGWVYRTTTGTYKAIFGATISGAADIFIASDGDNDFKVEAQDDSIFGSAIAVNTWTHLAVTYDSSDNLRAYLNGVPDGTGTGSGTSESITQIDVAVYPGASAGVLLAGNLTNVSLWSRVLTVAEVVELAGGKLTSSLANQDNLEALYTFNSDFTDSSGNSLDLALTGSPTAGNSSPASPITSIYPDLPNGTIFNETDTYKYFMWNGTDTWNQMVSS